MTAAEPAPDVTDDGVLDGRLRLLQPRRGHRVGHDAILLAAAVDAGPGAHAVDLGAGIGGAGLALAVRLQQLRVTLVEIDPALVALAAENIRRNGLDARARTVALDVAARPGTFAAAGLAPSGADHVLMNPPFNDPERQQASPDQARRLAHIGATGLLAQWSAAAAGLLRSDGILTLLWRPERLTEAIEALAAVGFGGVAVLPIHPRPDRVAIRVLVRAQKAGQGPLRIVPGLTLADAEGRPTGAAEAVLRHAAAIAFPA